MHIFDRWYDVRCEIRTIHGLSAHADADELMRFLAPALAEKTHAFVVHGEADQAEALAARLVEKGVKTTTVPAMTTSTTLFGSSFQSKQAATSAVTDGD